MATTSDRSRSKSSSEGDSLTSLLMRCELCIFVHSRRRRRRLDRLYLCARSKFMSAIDAQLDAHCNYIHVLVSVRCAPVHQATDFYDGTGPRAHCGFSCRSCFFLWKYENYSASNVGENIFICPYLHRSGTDEDLGEWPHTRWPSNGIEVMPLRPHNALTITESAWVRCQLKCTGCGTVPMQTRTHAINVIMCVLVVCAETPEGSKKSNRNSNLLWFANQKTNQISNEYGHKEHEEFRAKIKIDFRSIKLKCGEAIENEKKPFLIKTKKSQ